jgi:hypothetical protein
MSRSIDELWIEPRLGKEMARVKVVKLSFFEGWRLSGAGFVSLYRAKFWGEQR